MKSKKYKRRGFTIADALIGLLFVSLGTTMYYEYQNNNYKRVSESEKQMNNAREKYETKIPELPVKK